MKIKAKFPGKCRTCGEKFEAGTEIVWTQVDGAECLSCAYGVDPSNEVNPVEITDEMLKGLAAAVEMATETGQRTILHKAVQAATDALGVVPDLTEGMSYDEALGALVATKKDLVAHMATSRDVGEPIDEPDSMQVPGYGSVMTWAGLKKIAKECTPSYTKEVKILPEPKLSSPAAGSAIESKPIDPEQEDDEWLGQW